MSVETIAWVVAQVMSVPPWVYLTGLVVVIAASIADNRLAKAPVSPATWSKTWTMIRKIIALLDDPSLLVFFEKRAPVIGGVVGTVIKAAEDAATQEKK